MAKRYKGLEANVQVGFGTDINTGSIKFTGVKEDKLYTSQNGGAALLHSPSEYEDFSKYSENEQTSTSITDLAAAFNTGVSVGLFKGQLEAAFNKREESSKNDLKIEKHVGILRTKKYYLPYDYSTSSIDIKNPQKPNEDAARLTAAMLMNGLGENIIKKLEEIENEVDKNRKKEQVKLFYKEYGTHVITSIVKGQIGYYDSVFTRKQIDSGSTISAAVKVGFSYMFISGGASVSYGHRTTFSSKEFNVETNTYITPDNEDLLAALNGKKQELEESIKNLHDLNSRVTIPSESEIKGKYPEIPKPPELDEDQKNEIKKREEKKQKEILTNGIRNLISKLKNTLSDIIKKDTPSEIEVKEVEKICNSLEDKANDLKNKGELSGSQKKLLDKANSVTETYLSNCDLQDVENTKELLKRAYKFLSGTTDAGVTEPLEKPRKENNLSDSELPKTALSGILNFANWLHTYHSNAIKDANYSSWFNTLNVAVILQLREKWLKELVEKNIITTNELEMRLNDNYVDTLPQPTPSYVDSNAEFAKLDFGTAPWKEIFPFLESDALVDPIKYIYIKGILKAVEKYLLDYAYLSLVIRKTDNVAKLEEIKSKDQDLHKKATSFITSLAKADLGGKIKCTLSENQELLSLKDCSEQAAQYINNQSHIYSSAWYGVVEKLQSKEIITPIGCLVARFMRPTLKDLKLVDFRKGSNDNVGKDHSYSKKVLSDDISVGELLYDLMSQQESDFNVTTVLPLVPSDASLNERNDRAYNIQLMDRNGNVLKFDGSDLQSDNVINEGSVKEGNVKNFNGVCYRIKNLNTGHVLDQWDFKTEPDGQSATFCRDDRLPSHPNRLFTLVKSTNPNHKDCYRIKNCESGDVLNQRGNEVEIPQSAMFYKDDAPDHPHRLFTFAKSSRENSYRIKNCESGDVLNQQGNEVETPKSAMFYRDDAPDHPHRLFTIIPGIFAGYSLLLHNNDYVHVITSKDDSVFGFRLLPITESAIDTFNAKLEDSPFKKAVETTLYYYDGFSKATRFIDALISGSSSTMGKVFVKENTANGFDEFYSPEVNEEAIKDICSPGALWKGITLRSDTMRQLQQSIITDLKKAKCEHSLPKAGLHMTLAPEAQVKEVHGTTFTISMKNTIQDQWGGWTAVSLFPKGVKETSCHVSLVKLQDQNDKKCMDIVKAWVKKPFVSKYEGQTFSGNNFDKIIYASMLSEETQDDVQIPTWHEDYKEQEESSVETISDLCPQQSVFNYKDEL